MGVKKTGVGGGGGIANIFFLCKIEICKFMACL